MNSIYTFLDFHGKRKLNFWLHTYKIKINEVLVV